MNLLKAMATVAGMTGLSRIAGFVRDMMTAAILGAGPVADAFFIALKLPNLFRRITAEGAFSVSFVPLYSKTIEDEGEEEAARFAGNAFSVMFLILSVFTILAVIFMPYMLYAIAPGFADDPVRYNLSVEFSRVSFPYLLLMSLTALLGGVMNAHHRFAPFAFVPTLFNLSLIAALLLNSYFPTPGHALSWGLLAAGFLQLGFLWASMKRARLHIVIARPRLDKKIRKVFHLMGPGLVGAGVVQINLFFDIMIASFLGEGAISYLYYADRLNQLPLGVVGIAVGTALLPLLSRALARAEKDGHDNGEARDLFNRALEYCLILALPASAALAVIPLTLITVLFERGAFTAADSQVTAMILACYAIGLPAYITTKVFSTVHWARHDTKTPVKISIVGVLSNILVAVSLAPLIGVTGIALATGLTAWIQYVMHVRAVRKYPQANLDDRFLRNLPKIVAATCIMAASLFILATLLEEWVIGAPSVYRFTALAGLVLAGGAVYAAGVLTMGVLRVKDLKRLIKRSNEQGS
ncbi:MAG: murein biosynthesis integral membrane protein MurJ [Alphaproteobacteria bacterium]|nr:murein biosynthesis integral membrane protein MurJ [Alphaproteobacteria bacterium]MCB9975956.1 murein biosynthesis integral membrane protein MurJ [Rhodospirillales bacterium]